MLAEPISVQGIQTLQFPSVNSKGEHRWHSKLSKQFISTDSYGVKKQKGIKKIIL